jgi:hypothetical protein
MTIIAEDQVPATGLILAGEAWLDRMDANLSAAETRLNTQVAARLQLRSRLEQLGRLSCSLASDAAKLIASAAENGSVAGSDDVDMRFCDLTDDGARSATVHIPDDDEANDETVRSKPYPLPVLFNLFIDLST